MMIKVFDVCFLVGAILAVTSFILGHIMDITGFDGVDLDMDMDGEVDFNLLDSGIVPLSPTVYLIFFTVFGGVGKILMSEIPGKGVGFITAIAVVSGLIVAFIINKFVILPLKKCQTTSATPKSQALGLEGVVTETIYENGYGEVTYVVDDSTYTSPAKSLDGKEIIRGKNVLIKKVEENLIYVSIKED